MQAEVGPVLDGERRQGAEYFPRTVRQFNGWDGSQNSRSALRPFEAFKVNANVTLRKRSDILERVVAVIKNLRNQQESTPRRAQPDTHAVLKERLAREVLMRAQLEEALIHLKRENKQLARENDGLKTQRDSIKQEARRAVKRLELRLARVELERKTQE
ncbi:hypothetical protein [Paraburkholderia kururiensis]|uniref:hypothetical protein n=1 Tax=Paraburkholderia kururiensis TaxID=984307 RepID=UPI000F861678|nr:hypothetical protein [Paraburkholderia kururiensis]